MAARAYTQREWRLLSWWLATFHPDAAISMQVRLGPNRGAGGLGGLDDAQTLMLRVRNRWADAIFVENGDVYLVEAKLDPDPGIFSQLVHYARKFRTDPNYAAYATTPLRLVALVYHDDPSVAIEAPWYGVQWVVYQPDLATLPPVANKLQTVVSGDSPLPSDWPARLSSWGIRALGGV